MIYLFVYGTLKENCRNNHYLCDQRLVRKKAVTKPFYRLFDNGYFLMMIRSKEKGYEVTGEIWKVKNDTVEEIDEHEVSYIRRLIRVKNFKKPVFAYIYKYRVKQSEECYGEWFQQ